MRLIDADSLLVNILAGIEDAPLYIQATVEQYIDAAPTVEALPNDPLIPEQLRAMIGEPVWLSGSGLDRWDILSGISTDGLACFIRAALPMERCGKDWVPYRCKPELC